MKSHVFAFAAALFAPVVMAQHAAPIESTSSAAASAEARQFDFLLGQWDLDVHPKVGGLAAMIHGAPKLAGTLKVRRVLDGLVIEDEMRIVDASGNPVSLTRALRVWSRDRARWIVTSIDAYHAHASESTGQFKDGEMHTDSRSTDNEGKTVLSRTRYYEIGADGFRMQQDRSVDNGASWEEAVLTIEAKRTAATATP